MRFISLCAAMMIVASCAGPADPPEETANAAADSGASALPGPEEMVVPVDGTGTGAEMGEAADAAEAAEAAADAAASGEVAESADTAAWEGAAESAETAAETAAPVAGTALPSIRPPPDAGEATTSDTVFCAPVRRRLSAADCETFKDQQASLESGVAAFEPPPKMIRGRVERVRFAIGSDGDRAATVRAAGGRGSDAGVVPIRIGRFMTATLSGANFKITPIGDPGRDLGASSSELWEWDVEPQREGSHGLQVRVETFAEGDDGQRTRLSLYRSPPISVEVVVTPEDASIDAANSLKKQTTVWQGVIEALTGWAGAAAALVLALSLLFWRLRTFGRKPDTGEGAEGEETNGPPPPP